MDLPYTPGAGITAGFQAHLQAVLQGLPSPSTGSCYGSKQPDTGFLRGYVTIDTVNACNLFFPSDWAFYAPFVTDQNVLWGDWFLVDPLQGSAVGSPLVHIESAGGPAYGGAPNAPFAPGDHTFYGRYNGATADDQREPLPTTLAMRYLSGGDFSGGTDFIIWREADESDTPYNCNLQGPPSWYPLEATQIVMFDEAENPVTSESCRSGDPTCQQEVVIPNEAQRVDPAVDLLSPFPFGWAWLNLQHAEVTPIYGDTAAQAWGTTVMDALGRFSVGLDAIQLDNANNPNTVILPIQ